MLIIDTNTLYYTFGLSKHNSVSKEAIRKVIAGSTNVSISSISLAEFLTKYHKHAGIVRKVCSYMRQNRIMLLTNQYIPFQNDIIKTLAQIRQKDLDDLYKKLVILKSNVESKFATAVFFTVLMCETIFACNIDPYAVPSCIYDFFSLVFKDSARPLISNLFVHSYLEAYKTDDAENIIREDFYNYLALFISLCLPLCQHFMIEYKKLADGEILDIPSILSHYKDADWATEMENLQKKIRKKDTPAHFVKSQGLVYGKAINDKHLSSLLSGLSASFKKILGTSAIEEYLFSIVRNTISNGGAFRKNDINDALILSALKSQDLILTFDDRMILHMEKHSDIRYEYKNSVALIQSQLDNC